MRTNLEICDSGHDEVCFIGKCPACSMLVDLSGKDDEIRTLEKKIESLEEELVQYEDMNLGERIAWAIKNE